MKLSLSDAIEGLRSELEKAQRYGQNKNLKFDVGDIELELEVAAETGTTTGGKFNWYVVTGEIGSNQKNTTKHRVKIKLTAIGKDGQQVQVSDSPEQPPR